MAARVESAAQAASAKASLIKARAAQKGKPRSAAQQAALSKAQHLPRTAAQIAAAKSNLIKARLVEARMPRSAAQLAALVKARRASAISRHAHARPKKPHYARRRFGTTIIRHHAAGNGSTRRKGRRS